MLILKKLEKKINTLFLQQQILDLKYLLLFVHERKFFS